MRIPRGLINRKYSTNNNNFYVTTPIYYVNATPHIGHLYSSVIADAAQRWRSLVNNSLQIRFATGTDEHGTKIQQAAQRNNTSLDTYCTGISQKYRHMSDFFSIKYTDFIRTTSPAHKNAVRHFWETLDKNGHIYSKVYGGWYCVSDETFLTESQLKETTSKGGEKVFVSSESGHPVEWTEEQNYMFRLSAFQDDLKNWLTRCEDVVKPKKFQKILIDMISDDALPDVSISRPASRVHWGIEVPGDSTQTVYVWLDALVNYLTVVGYPLDEGKGDVFRGGIWPPDLQVIGKDILKFHGIYWPAFLMAAGLEPPKSILCHSHWTVDGEKMSKSRNNVVCPLQRSEIYTAEGLRYFLLREGVAHSDGNYSDTKVVRILNSEIADTLGNLLSRCTGSALNSSQMFPALNRDAFRDISSRDVTKKLMESVESLPDVCYQHYEEYNFYKVADVVVATLHAANLFFETMKPWELKKNADTLKHLDVVLHLTLETLRICGIVLQPIIPNITNALLNKISTPVDRRTWRDVHQLSWKTEDFKATNLSDEKIILFKRIITEDHQQKQKAKKS